MMKQLLLGNLFPIGNLQLLKEYADLVKVNGSKTFFLNQSTKIQPVLLIPFSFVFFHIRGREIALAQFPEIFSIFFCMLNLLCQVLFFS